MRRVFFALALFVPALAARPASILDQVIETYGGVRAWSGVVSIKQTGVVGTTMRGEGGVLTRELTVPDQLRITIQYPNSTEVRVVRGREGTRNGVAVTGPQLDAMRLQCARIDLPRLLIAKRKAVIDRGAGVRNGIKVRLFELPLDDGLILTMEIDPSTKHIIHTTGTLPLQNGGRMAFEAGYSDFRRIEGRLFAFRETNIAGGVVTGETRLEKVEVVVKA